MIVNCFEDFTLFVKMFLHRLSYVNCSFFWPFLSFMSCLCKYFCVVLNLRICLFLVFSNVNSAYITLATACCSGILHCKKQFFEIATPLVAFFVQFHVLVVVFFIVNFLALTLSVLSCRKARFDLIFLTCSFLNLSHYAFVDFRHQVSLIFFYCSCGFFKSKLCLYYFGCCLLQWHSPL